MTTVSIIAAIGKNRELGKDNQLLWHIPEDLKRFKKITLGYPVIMGRKTFESLGKPLPGRTNIVVSRRNTPGVLSLKAAIVKAKSLDPHEIFIIGGGQIYEQGIKYADKLYLTIVDAIVPDADTYFPDYSEFTKEVYREEKQDENLKYAFIELVR